MFKIAEPVLDPSDCVPQMKILPLKQFLCCTDTMDLDQMLWFQGYKYPIKAYSFQNFQYGNVTYYIFKGPIFSIQIQRQITIFIVMFSLVSNDLKLEITLVCYLRMILYNLYSFFIYRGSSMDLVWDILDKVSEMGLHQSLSFIETAQRS